MTLTGRTELWATVIEMIREHPWFGYGYSGFWLGWDGESAGCRYIYAVIYDQAFNRNNIGECFYPIHALSRCPVLFTNM